MLGAIGSNGNGSDVADAKFSLLGPKPMLDPASVKLDPVRLDPALADPASAILDPTRPDPMLVTLDETTSDPISLWIQTR